MRLALVVLGLVVGLGLAEGGLRVWSRTGTPLAWKLHEWDPDASQLEPLGTNCFRARPLAVLPYANGTAAHVNALGWRGPEVATPKPPGVYRVVLVGGSTAHGFLVDDDETIDAHLRRALGDAAAGRIEVVNLGLDGLDTVCDLERLRLEGLRLEPDALVVHAGVNDTLALRHAELALDAPERGFRAERRRVLGDRVRQHPLWVAAKRHLLLARLPGIVGELWRGHAPAAGPPEPAGAALDAFETRIRAMVESMPAGTVVVLSTPPSLLRRRADPPATACGGLIVDAATTQRYRDRLDARLRHVAAEPGAARAQVRYAAHDLPAGVFLDDCHVTGDGNRLLAADFARALAPEPPRHAQNRASR